MNIPPTLQAAVVAAAGAAMAQAMADAHLRAFQTHPEDMANALKTAAQAVCFEAIEDGAVDLEQAAKDAISEKLDEDPALDLEQIAEDQIERAVERIDLDKITSAAESSVQDEVESRLNRIDVDALVRDELADHIAQPVTHEAVVQTAGRLLAEAVVSQAQAQS